MKNLINLAGPERLIEEGGVQEFFALDQGDIPNLPNRQGSTRQLRCDPLNLLFDYKIKEFR